MDKKQRKRLIFAIVGFAIAVILAVYSWNVLPDSVVTQIGKNPNPDTNMPKIVAVMIPLGISGMFSYAYVIGKASNMLYTCLGYAVAILLLLSNR